MKKNVLKICFILVTAIFTNFSSQAQFIVKVRPTNPVVVRPRPVAPGPRYTWIDGDWVWRNGRYVYTDGRWVLPARGARWIPGHWKQNPRRGGWYWVAGHWRRR